MGVIFRNGIPYGVSQSDVTTVDTIADLDNIENPKEEHIYVVKAVNQPYRYDSTEEEFYPLSAELPTINARNNAIITGDGNSWAKSNISSFEIQSTETDNLIATRYTNKGAVFGTFITNGQAINLINGFRSKDNSLIDMGGNAKIYMDGDTRLAIHDNAWMDVTGTGTQVKVNSGSKVYIDSQYGPNNLMMHGAWIAINDAKNPSSSKPQFRYRIYKSECPEEPDKDYVESHGTIDFRSKKFSRGYPYIDSETTFIDELTDVTDLYTIGYEFDEMTVSSSSTRWTVIMSYKKIVESSPDVNINGGKAMYYDEGDWPQESENVPRINFTGAPHVTVADQTNVNISNGAYINFDENSKTMITRNSVINMSDSWIHMYGANSVIPFIECGTESNPTDGVKQISFGFTEKDLSTYVDGDHVHKYNMLSIPPIDSFPVTWKSQTEWGPYHNFSIVQTRTYEKYLDAFLNEKSVGVNYNRASLLPFVNFGGKTYFVIDSKGEYIHHAGVGDNGYYAYTPRIGDGATCHIHPAVGANGKFYAYFGCGGNATSVIKATINSEAKSDILWDAAEKSNTYIRYGLPERANFGLELSGGEDSNYMFKITTCSGNTWINGIKQNRSGGIIQNTIDGVDTYSLQAAYSHKEAMDYSRFIMRGENIYYNTPAIWFLYDCTQDYADNTGGRIPDNKLHLQHGWDRPISNDSDNFKNEKSPTFQMYECSNLILRGWWNYPTQSVTIPTDAYASLSTPQEISLTELKSHPTEWAYFLSQFTDNNKEFIGLVPRSTIVATSQSITVTRARYQYTSAYANAKVNKYHPNAGLDTFGKRSSLIEITDNSELRMWDGICIYARYNPETNEPGIEIVNRFDKNGTDGSGAAGEIDRVEFTFEELKYLKRFIGTIPSRLANDTSGMTESDTLYFLPVGGGGGGGGEELPNATSEDF